jgi:hypothetical protein
MLPQRFTVAIGRLTPFPRSQPMPAHAGQVDEDQGMQDIAEIFRGTRH